MTEFIQNQRKLNPRFCRRSYWSLAWSLFHRIVPQCSSICLPYQLICRVINYVCFTLSCSVVQVTHNRVAPIKIPVVCPVNMHFYLFYYFFNGLFILFQVLFYFIFLKWSEFFKTNLLVKVVIMLYNVTCMFLVMRRKYM